jgi:RimJ/RimL family protein N-acetyltransferase
MAPRLFVQTPRLRMREFAPADAQALVQMHRDPRVGALLVDDYPLHDAEHSSALIDALGRIYRSHEGHGIWHCERVIDGAWRYCGFFNLLPVDGEPDSAEIGCRLLPEAWGTAIPLEGGLALLDHAFARLALPRVVGFCHPNNRSVQLTLLTLGFEPRGERDYSGARAQHFVITPALWAVTRNEPRRLRLRWALDKLRAGAPGCAVQG